MNKAVKIAASTLSTLGLVGGFAGVVGASPSISTTGPDSHNTIKSRSSWEQRVTNTNNVTATNTNWQSAHTGSVNVSHNTTAGDATSGAARNNNSFSADVSIANHTGGNVSGVSSNGADGSIDHTGPDSTNKISNSTKVSNTVNNTNSVHVTNDNQQSACSGSVNVSDNTTGGNATSGDASNSNTSTVSLNISN